MTARCLRRNKRWAFTKFCFFLYVVISVFALVWLRTTVVNLSYELSQLENQKARLLREGRLFSAERANLYSAGKIEEIAIKDLGMGFPKRDKIFFVKKVTGAIPYKASINLVKEDVSNEVKSVPTDIASEKNKLDMRAR